MESTAPVGSISQPIIKEAVSFLMKRLGKAQIHPLHSTCKYVLKVPVVVVGGEAYDVMMILRSPVHISLTWREGGNYREAMWDGGDLK